MYQASHLFRGSFVILCPMVCVLPAISAPAQETTTRPVVRIAEVNANDVYVRSGDSTNHYPVCKLSAGTRVSVLSRRGEWVEILPPAGTFSLISGDYVETSDDKTGVVSGSNVRVRAGSSLNKSKYTVQTMLDHGAKVTILGRNPDGFLRIKPPSGASLWIHADYLSDAPSTGAPAPRINIPTAGSHDADGATDPAKIDRTPGTLASPTSNTALTSTSPGDAVDLTWRKELEALDAATNAEMEKDPADRDLEALRARYGTIVAQQDDEYARRYAEIRLAEIENLQSLALAVRRVRSLSTKADGQRQEFMDRRASLPRTMPNLPSGVTAQGELRVSALYPPGSTVRRYRLIEPSAPFERTIGYVEIPEHGTIDVETFIGRYVGVRASRTRLQKGGVDPIPIYVAEELLLLEAPATAPQEDEKD